MAENSTMQEQTPQQKLGERSLSGILNETFAVYGRRFTKLVTLVAVVQFPLSLMTLLLALIFSNAPVASGAFAAIAVGLGIFSYGALTCAVGQHYVLDEVSVSGCYTRVLWRAVSMVLLATLVVLLLMLMLAPLLFTSPDAPSPLVIFSLLFGVVLIVYLLYQTFMIPAVVVEGYRFSGAVRRGFKLARGSELRIAGHLLVYGLVAFGMFFVIGVPFQLASVLISGEEVNLLSQITEAVGLLVAGVLVAPITVIATTLLYYDFRVRKEGYDISRLSKEMGVAPA